MLGIEYESRVVNFPSYTVFCVNCILKIHSILNALSSEYAKVLMHQESKYAIVTKGSK